MFPVPAAAHQESPFSFYPVENSQHSASVVLSDNAVYCRQILRARRTAVEIASLPTKRSTFETSKLEWTIVTIMLILYHCS